MSLQSRALTAVHRAVHAQVFPDDAAAQQAAVDAANDALRNDYHYAVITAESTEFAPGFVLQIDGSSEAGDAFRIRYRYDVGGNGVKPLYVESESINDGETS